MPKKRHNYELEIRLKADRALAVDMAAERLLEAASRSGWARRGPIPLKKVVWHEPVSPAAGQTHVGRNRIRRRVQVVNGVKQEQQALRRVTHSRLVFITLPDYAEFAQLEQIILPSDVEVETSYGVEKGSLPIPPKELLDSL